jgi:transcriptional regulator with XRE-family HTH domain
MNKQGARTPEAIALRKDGGIFLKALRNHAGLTQRELAEKLKMNYYTMIAQMEAGTARVPPDSYVPYAKALGVDAQLFVRKLMQYYDPHTYKALWGRDKVSLTDLIS